MIEKRKADVLLSNLVEEAGVAYLSDLRQINSPRYLFSVFENVSKKYYSYHKKSGCFYHITGKYGPKLSAEKSTYCSFHLLSQTGKRSKNTQCAKN